MKRYKDILFIIIFLSLLWFAGYLSTAFTPYDPITIQLENKLISPGERFLCGTDELGRDIFSRILVGFSNTIKVSIMTLVTSFFIGIIAGSIAGFFYNTLIDKVFNWLAAMLFSLPFLLIIVSIMSLMEKTLFNAYMVMTAVIWISPARIVRAGVVKALSSEFVLAERAMGMPEWKILFRSLLPNSITPAFIFSFKYFPEIIGMEAGLSFLGLGVQPPHPGLGKMIFDGINYLGSAWWYAFSPALLLFVIVLLSNLFYSWIGNRWMKAT